MISGLTSISYSGKLRLAPVSFNAISNIVYDMLKQVADRPVDLSNQYFFSFIGSGSLSLKEKSIWSGGCALSKERSGKFNILWSWPPNRCIDTLKPMKSHSNIGLRLSLPLFVTRKGYFVGEVRKRGQKPLPHPIPFLEVEPKHKMECSALSICTHCNLKQLHRLACLHVVIWHWHLKRLKSHFNITIFNKIMSFPVTY
jgi:hypothetical protein